MSTPAAIVASVLLLLVNAFFVAAEFALVASRRHRLEEAAAEGGAAPRAALRSARELSMLLAGAQLGITMASVGLGAVAEPAIAHLVDPLLLAAGLPEQLSYLGGAVVALGVVTFLHIVIGEMGPKSWAISHPERAAIALALPIRAFITLTMPVLRTLNAVANLSLRVVRVQPRDEIASTHGPAEIRELVDHSAKAGLLAPERGGRLAGALELYRTPLRELVVPMSEVSSVPSDEGPEGVEAAGREAGHLRLVVLDGKRPVGVVHLRDVLTSDRPRTAGQLARPLLRLDGATPVYRALGVMQEWRCHLALVSDGRAPLGIVTLQDVLDRMFRAKA
ncbi:MAG: DUF21 domain-containing protein [Streptosporangiales bacterium]|nr:DUF21 domain-containing protein [Streptosporangiales bacterium]